MQGEYRGDFTRDTFYQANHFCRVLMQQGRVQLDADWNEQTAIILHLLRSLTRDIIGQHGGPNPPAGSATPGGFAIGTVVNERKSLADLNLAPGHYYVDGILCEIEAPTNPNAAGVTYLTQPDFPALMQPDSTRPPALPNLDGNALVYLDVWERHLANVQQELIREVALGGPDTASRSQVVWQVKIQPTLPDGLAWPNAKLKLSDSQWQNWINVWQPANRGWLKAQIQPQPMSTSPCVISPQSAYRGTENQLYRVEIHTGGAVAAPPTFKWSRENGSVVFPILKLATSAGQTTVTLANLGRDERLSLKNNDWVEVVDDIYARSGQVDSLLQVTDIDAANQVVTLNGASGIVVGQPPTTHPILRRWDGTGQVAESSSDWLALEDGIQIQFQPPAAGASATQYRSGDYWLIPARVATGNIEWPQQTDSQGKPAPAALPPHGVEHHYAPLAVISGAGAVADLRRTYDWLAK
jgi:hypothetical protein